jgi:hypothetical protein
MLSLLYLIEIFTVSLGLHLVARDEAKGRRVDAVAQTAAVGRTVRETWPRWLSACTDLTSVRTMPCALSRTSFTFAGTIGLVKLGQPVPESNLSVEANSGSPDTMST